MDETAINLFVWVQILRRIRFHPPLKSHPLAFFRRENNRNTISKEALRLLRRSTSEHLKEIRAEETLSHNSVVSHDFLK